MKVAHLIDTLAWGGAQKLLVDFGNASSHQALEVLVIVLRRNAEPGPYALQLERAGVSVKFLSITTLFDLSAIPQLLRILREEKVDILHTHLSHANTLGGIAGRLARIPVVATLHNVWLPSTANSSARLVVERFVLRFLTRKLIAVGNIVADTHQAVFPPNKFCIIPNPVNRWDGSSRMVRDQLRAEIMGTSFQRMILAIGRLLPRKGYTELLIAFAKVRDQHPDAMLAIAGDSGLRDRYEAEARSLNLNGSVHFLGFRSDITSLLSAADLYVNSSHWEGLSVAMLEAMSAGIPVLATSVGDAPYLLGEGRGALVPPGDIEGFAKELSHLLSHPEILTPMGQRGRAFVEEHYSVDAWLDELLKIYDEVMSKSS